MAVRRYKVLRSSGQNVPPCKMQTIEFLQSGANLIAWPEPFQVELAAAAWAAHKNNVLENWKESCARFGVVPSCWAQRVFDNKPQISTVGLGYHAERQLQAIEHYVHLWKEKTK